MTGRIALLAPVIAILLAGCAEPAPSQRGGVESVATQGSDDSPSMERAPSPAAPPAPTVVLGSDMGPYGVGYGTERPAAISLGTCSNSIDAITWTDWGGPEAHGVGMTCSTSGPGQPLDLVASDLGECRGLLAYRQLQYASGTPQSICS